VCRLLLSQTPSLGPFGQDELAWRLDREDLRPRPLIGTKTVDSVKTSVSLSPAPIDIYTISSSADESSSSIEDDVAEEDEEEDAEKDEEDEDEGEEEDDDDDDKDDGDDEEEAEREGEDAGHAIA
jgi:hypothetical protein